MKSSDYDEAMEKLISQVTYVKTKSVDIERLSGRILSEDITAGINIPPFARSPYDGYAFISKDTDAVRTGEGNVTLRVIDNIRAGEVSKKKVTSGTAVRLMTGCPIPYGADSVCKYEDTDFTDETVTIKKKYSPGDNIIEAGEDIKMGSVVLKAGSVIDPGAMGIISSLGMSQAKVFRRLRAGILTTGDEVVDVKNELSEGMIHDSNRYIISSALRGLNAKVSFIGHAADNRESIRGLIEEGLKKCDVIISTGGVSAGDYDLIPEVMEDAGFEILTDGVSIKPGMACVYGIKSTKLMLALSGNPASALTNLHCVCMPALKKMAGYGQYRHELTEMRICSDFTAKGRNLRFLRGRTKFEKGEIFFDYNTSQGNVVISSAAGANAYVMVKPGDGIKTGDIVKGFMI
ncbi:MAG: molybdopterin molybdotransferase MoeA [Lachnospiraceae bacterium]|nr:molybdopterin molybdotransferase MoeA [Lachnospiraceae bacterium]